MAVRGAETRRRPVPAGHLQDLLRLQNGNAPVACGTQARLLEVDRAGKIVWQFTRDDHPELNFTNACTLQQSRYGPILATNFLRGSTGRGDHALIVSPARAVVWALTDHQQFKAFSQVWAFED
jgi:hypothetical protein